MKWHYVITLEIPNVATATYDQVVDVPEGTSAQRVYQRARELGIEDIKRKAPAGIAMPTVLTTFWSLTKDELR